MTLETTKEDHRLMAVEHDLTVSTFRVEKLVADHLGGGHYVFPAGQYEIVNQLLRTEQYTVEQIAELLVNHVELTNILKVA